MSAIPGDQHIHFVKARFILSCYIPLAGRNFRIQA
jgi:hypothetical protein